MEQAAANPAAAETKQSDFAPGAVTGLNPLQDLENRPSSTAGQDGARSELRDGSKRKLTSGSNGRSGVEANGSASPTIHTIDEEFGEPAIGSRGTGSGYNTPPVRRSVQFSRTPTQFEDTPTASTNHDGKDRRSLFSKLRSLSATPGTPSHLKTQSGFATSEDIGGERGVASHTEQVKGRESDFETEEDADNESSDAGEGPSNRLRRRPKKSRRPQNETTPTAPATPKGPPRERPNFFSIQSSSANLGRLARPSFLPRRNTMPETQEEDRIGVSEDEGRQRMAENSPWRRGLRNMSYSQGRRVNTQSPDDARPSTFRRAFTGLAGTSEGREPSSPWRARADRGTSLSAAKWRQIKAGIRMMARRKPPTIDQTKSAELLAELCAGVPAALIVASMFQRDQKGHRRIPVLLEQLKVRLTYSGLDTKTDERHPQFRLEMEYGNGLSRMKWVVVRSVRDFWALHSKYKTSGVAKRYLQLKSDKTNNPNTPRFPRFPRSVFPYLRTLRGFEMSESEEEIEDAEGAHGDPSRERPAIHRRAPSLGIMRRRSSINDALPSGSISGPGAVQPRGDPWPERQRRKLEAYINQMIRYFMFRADSNRLCKFLELSAMGIRLASEGSYHGKEGYLLLQSSKGVDFRKALTPTNVSQRHTFKWFLVRHSYIVCIESPEEMNIYDVFFIDSDFQIVSKNKMPMRERKPKDFARSAKASATHPQHHKLKLVNSERKLRLFAKTERQMYQFKESIEQVLKTSPWAQTNRFDSFAPVRHNTFARFLVDGRDYMWNVSRAILMAKDVIYIHDWWLSPELYMRRPAAISQDYRLDRLLKRKAEEGVKIYVIMYRNIESAIPIDSNYSKFSLLELGDNVFVQRSPNQIRQGTFFWAHHEKICIIDHTIAFCGGVDLCFGRWDTPSHDISDDKPTGFENAAFPLDSDHCQMWPGKDYSNPRVQDFYSLDKPFEEMYDRNRVPRMPWHDIAMQIVGQPARDLTRHFVQRWNFILRQRKPSRPTPFLLPPPDFDEADVEALGIGGTCSVQILRSCAMWSMGTPDRVEHSIMNAYCKMIEESTHFVYIENQFFVSTSEWENVKIENKIGDALVERIIRAHNNDENWRAVIVIPLMPGFQNTVDVQDGTSVRLIMQCQYRSICRGPASIFGRLLSLGIDPEHHIHFYSLRSWGKIGPTKALTSEQLYIHAKCMIVDDRRVIIGSANINERSMLGNRDSEVAAIVEDKDLIWTKMDGEPHKASRFAHSLRMRLMREHLGIDVDNLAEDEYESVIDGKPAVPNNGPDNSPSADETASQMEERLKSQRERVKTLEIFPSFNHDAAWQQADNPNLKSGKKITADPRVTGNEEHRKDVDGEGVDRWKANETERGRARERAVTNSTSLDTQSNHSKSANRDADIQNSSSLSEAPRNASLPLGQLIQQTSKDLSLPLSSTMPKPQKVDDTDIGGPRTHPMVTNVNSIAHNPQLAELRRPEFDKNSMIDPLHPDFYDEVWHRIAENNTILFRSVFRCMPDNEVKTWAEYREFNAYSERFAQSQGGGKDKEPAQKGPNISGPPGAGNAINRFNILDPIGEGAEKAAEALSSRFSIRRSNDPKSANAAAERAKRFSFGQADEGLHEKDGVKKVQQWVDDANRANASRGTDASPEEALDEKSAIESNPDQPPPSASTQPSQNENEKSDVTQQTGRPHAGSATLEAPSIAYSNSAATEKGQQGNMGSQKRRRRATTRSSKREFRGSDDLLSSQDAEELLNKIQGHLVVWPYHWLIQEEKGGGWLYNLDILAPLEI